MSFYLLAALGVIVIGIDKAGFGGGIGLVAIVIFILAFGESKEAVAVMLPILCVCDLFALYHYHKIYDKRNLIRLIPGALAGILLGSFFLGKVTDTQLRFWIGVVAILFVIYQAAKTWIFKEMEAYKPKSWHGWIFGSLVGFTSTLAHAGGPPATMYLLPQNMGRQLYVGTTVILFTVVNYVKLIPYSTLGMINLNRLSTSVMLMIFVPIGTWLGVWMNKRINETVFRTVVYSFLFLMGVRYVMDYFGMDPVQFLISRV